MLGPRPSGQGDGRPRKLASLVGGACVPACSPSPSHAFLTCLHFTSLGLRKAFLFGLRPAPRSPERRSSTPAGTWIPRALRQTFCPTVFSLRTGQGFTPGGLSRFPPAVHTAWSAAWISVNACLLHSIPLGSSPQCGQGAFFSSAMFGVETQSAAN